MLGIVPISKGLTEQGQETMTVYRRQNRLVLHERSRPPEAVTQCFLPVRLGGLGLK